MNNEIKEQMKKEIDEMKIYLIKEFSKRIWKEIWNSSKVSVTNNQILTLDKIKRSISRVEKEFIDAIKN